MLIEFAFDKNRGVVELIQEPMRVQSLKYKSKVLVSRIKLKHNQLSKDLLKDF